MAEKSAIKRIKELDDERAKIFDQAKEEALQKATQLLVQFIDKKIAPVKGAGGGAKEANAYYLSRQAAWRSWA
jgi:hypothetical protein